MAKHIHITIRLGNDAMRTPDDVAEALKALAPRIRGTTDPHGLRVLDANGNTVGHVRVEGR